MTGSPQSTAATRGPTRKQIAFIDAMCKELLERDPRGELLERLDDPELLARTTADAVFDAASVWEDLLSPFYDVNGVRQLLSQNRKKPISRQAVSKRKGLLALTTGSGNVVYPAFQFGNPIVLDGVATIVKLLPADLVSPWMVASWLVSQEPELESARPIDVIKEGGIQRVVAVAHDWARALAQ